MLFVVKKIISFILGPLTVILILQVLGLLLIWREKCKRAGLWLISLGIIAFVLAGYGLIGNAVLEDLEHRYPPLQDIPVADGARWVVVLGAGMTSDPRVPLTSQLSEGSAVRTMDGIRIWRQLKSARLLFSGGAVFNTRSEAYGMAKLARQLGVPDSAIITEDNSLDTDDQARLIKEIVKDEMIVLVTSAAHMQRSVLLFKKQGVSLVPAPTNYLIKKDQKFKPSRLFPSSGNIQAAEVLFHEYLGLAWSKLRGRI